MTYSLSTQEHIDFKVTIEGLDPDGVLLQTLEGEEALSLPFVYRAVLQSSQSNVDVQQCIGKNISIDITLGTSQRHIHGTIGRMKLLSPRYAEAPQGRAFYQIECFPKFWTLQFSSECHIFQHKKALDIIKEVLQAGGVVFQDQTMDTGFEPLPYCVQYNESHFAFVSRLMESIGVFYFFTFAAGTHTMVLGNDASAHPSCPEGGTVAMDWEGINDFNQVRSAALQAQMVTGGFAHKDYDYKKPSTPLSGSVSGAGMAIEGQVYEYPGDFLGNGAGASLANIHLQEAESLKVTLEGASSVPFFTAGHKFTLVKNPRADLNAGYILSRVVHRWRFDSQEEEGGEALASQELYSNTYLAFPDTVTFRPPRVTPRPRIHGTQTAVVTGKAGEEIWTDQYGRIKVSFPWDHLGSGDETSSCWIRVAQGWAGSGWGMLFTPRIGMEVVVSFICGDPDRPLVTGVVYNGEHMPPYLPEEPTKSTIYTNSSKGGGGYNEIRFEDKNGEEEIYVHAEKDMNIDVLHDRHTKIYKGHDILEVQKGFRTTTIKKDDTKTIEEGDELMTVAKGNYKRKVKGNYTMEIGGNLKIKVKGEIHLEGAKSYKLKAGKNITEDAGAKIDVKAGTSVKQEAGTRFDQKAGTNLEQKVGMNLQAKAGMNVQVEAGLNLMAKSGANTTIKAGAMGQLEAGAIQIIKGALVKIN